LGGDGLDLAQSLRAFFEEVKGPKYIMPKPYAFASGEINIL